MLGMGLVIPVTIIVIRRGCFALLSGVCVRVCIRHDLHGLDHRDPECPAMTTVQGRQTGYRALQSVLLVLCL